MFIIGKTFFLMDYSTKNNQISTGYWQNAVNGLQYTLNDCIYRLFYL